MGFFGALWRGGYGIMGFAESSEEEADRLLARDFHEDNKTLVAHGAVRQGFRDYFLKESGLCLKGIAQHTSRWRQK